MQVALKQGHAGPYQIQAAISGVHAHSADWQSTDWVQIVALYGELLKFEPTSVVRLNQAVAMCMAGRPEKAMAVLDDIENLEGYVPFHLAQAEVLERLRRDADARHALGLALEHTQNAAEAQFIPNKLGYLH